jgi:hypothetical protein
MAVLAKAEASEVSAAWERLEKPAYTLLRPPEPGLVLVRGRMGGLGDPFNLGEMAVTRSAVRLTTGDAVSGWAATIGGTVLLFLVQIIALVFTFCFLVLITRGQHAFIPAREYGIFVRNCTEVWPINATDRDAAAG